MLNPEVLLYNVCIPYIRDPEDALNIAVTLARPYLENDALRVSKIGDFIKEWWSRTHHHTTIAWRRRTPLARHLCYSCVIGNDENALRPSQETIRKALEVAMYRENKDYVYWAITSVSQNAAQDKEVFAKSQKWLSEQNARGSSYNEATTFGVDWPLIEDIEDGFSDDYREHLDANANNFTERMKLTFSTDAIYETMMSIDLCDRRIRSRVLYEHLELDVVLTWISSSSYDMVIDIVIWIAVRINEFGEDDNDFIGLCRKELIRMDHDCFRTCLLYRKLNDDGELVGNTKGVTRIYDILTDHRDAMYQFITDCIRLYGIDDSDDAQRPSDKESLVCVIRGLLRNIMRSKDRYRFCVHDHLIETAMMAMRQNSGNLVSLFLDAYLSLRRNPDEVNDTIREFTHRARRNKKHQVVRVMEERYNTLGKIKFETS